MQPIHSQTSILLTCFLCGLAGVVPVQAQETAHPLVQSRTSRYDTMKSVKEEIVGLMAENKKLEARYSELKAQWRILQIQQEAGTADPIAQGLDQYEAQQVPSEPDQSYRYLRTEGMGDSEELTLLELHLQDLQVQRSELELELKLLKVENQDKERDSLAELEQDKTALQAAVQREHQLQEILLRKEEAVKAAPTRTPVLERENKQLQEDILALEKKKEFKEKEVAILKDKVTLKEKSTEQIRTKLEMEHQELTARVEKMREEHGQLSDKVDTSLSRQQHRNELLQGIIKFDQENQQLQAKINEMSEKIKAQE